MANSQRATTRSLARQLQQNPASKNNQKNSTTQAGSSNPKAGVTQPINIPDDGPDEEFDENDDGYEDEGEIARKEAIRRGKRAADPEQESNTHESDREQSPFWKGMVRQAIDQKIAVEKELLQLRRDIEAGRYYPIPNPMPPGPQHQTSNQSITIHPDSDLTRKRNASSEHPAALARYIRPEPLSEYWGKSIREHQEWAAEADNKFILSAAFFPDEQSKIRFAMTSLRGDPKTAWFQHQVNLDYDTFTWRQFTDYLLDRIQDSANRELSAYQRFEHCQQGTSQSVQSFEAYFRLLEGQIAPLTPDQRRYNFISKLRSNLQSELMRTPVLPKTFDDVVSLAIRLENATGKRPGASRRGASNSRTYYQEGPREATRSRARGRTTSSTRFTRGRGGRNRGESSWRADSTAPDLSTVECYACGQKGHFASSLACPKQGNRNPNHDPVANVGNVRGSKNFRGRHRGSRRPT